MNKEERNLYPEVDYRDSDWLIKAREAYRVSTEYLDNSLRDQWEKNEALYRSRHPSGSKYHSDSYRFRSKIFRPKIRTACNRATASALRAFFSTGELVNIEAQNPDVKQQQASAEVMRELLNFRLSKSIPWFPIVSGAFQEAWKNGTCAAYVYWDYQAERKSISEPMFDSLTGLPVIDPATGKQAKRTRIQKTIIKDQPDIELIPLENIRIDPAAKWDDPINTSPYVIRMIPMHIFEVVQRMKTADLKTGKPKWEYLPPEKIKAATQKMYDSVRQEREGNQRTDSLYNQETGITDYSITWVHENIMRDSDGKDMVFYSLGTEHMLTEPKPLRTVYKHGKRPFVMGHIMYEPHRLYPAGVPELAGDLQAQANAIANQRIDNIELAMNKRYTAERGKQVDLRSLQRSYPGAITLVDKHDDIRPLETPEVTASAYREQDYNNADLDAITGNNDPSSINTNRKMGETARGMQLLSDESNAIIEMQIRTFSESFVEPVLRHLMTLEQQYESDFNVLAIAGNQARLHQRFGIDEVTDELLQGELTLNANVGIGNTNPQFRVERLATAFDAIAKYMPWAVEAIKPAELVKEIMGALGYKDGERFFGNLDEMPGQFQQLQQQLQQLQQELESKQAEQQAQQQTEQAKMMLKAKELDDKYAMQREKNWIDLQREWIDEARKGTQVPFPTEGSMYGVNAS